MPVTDPATIVFLHGDLGFNHPRVDREEAMAEDAAFWAKVAAQFVRATTRDEPRLSPSTEGQARARAVLG
jgi:hypothetical protein